MKVAVGMNERSAAITRWQMRFKGTSALILLLSGASVGSAEEACPLAPEVAIGSTIRFQAPGVTSGTFKGRVVDCDGESLALSMGRMSMGRSDAGYRVPYDAIRKLKVLRGKQRAAGGGALVGAASLGLLFGLAAYDGICSGECSDFKAHSFRRAPAGAALGGVVGGLLGAVIGSVFRQDRWERVEIQAPQVRVTARGREKGVAFALSVRF
jgi:hypothetical protein